ncbi:MAG: cytochrome c3 family protein, partial [Deltaproteobacteria bacterium]|nr:cytochrome c3 family protein [Deltaproteobacteria bacterium]
MIERLAKYMMTHKKIIYGIVFLFFLVNTVVIFGPKVCTKPSREPSLAIQESEMPDYHKDENFSLEHAQVFFKKRTECAQCHGVDFTGGKSKVSCQGCHEEFNYPHPKKWALRSNHGSDYLKTKNDEDKTFQGEKHSICLKCHEDSGAFAKKYPDQFVSCATCHPKIPHTLAFREDGEDDHAKL